MEHEIYNAEKHIDIEYIESILLKNEGKKIICFGGGTAAEILMRKILHKYHVYAFLDNNQELWETEIFGVKICSPAILKEIPIDSYIVLILSKHVNAISKQLEEMGLVKDANYYDLYNKFLPYFRIKKFEQYAMEFESFLKRIPDDTFDTIPIKSDKKIGIVCIAEMIKAVTWYPMAQCVLLRYRGYSSVLIMDHLKSFDDYIYFDGISEAAKAYTDYIIRILQEKCPDIEVKHIHEEDKAVLDEEDIKMTETYAPVVVKWLDSRRDEVFLPENPKRIQIAEGLLQSTMQNIKYFFQQNSFDVINVYTGIHRHRCVYNYIGHKYGMRVSTYDGDENGTTLYETDEVSGHAYDITKLIKENSFDEKEQEVIIKLAKDNFEKRKHSTVNDEGYNYQTVQATGSIIPYDVIIPLNISWDSAALARDDIFQDEIEWIKETLEFLMENTDATVMVREHPAQNVLPEFLYQDYCKKIPILKQYPERIYYADAKASINTYQYIQSCKVVLPYSSTIGVEAAMMGKNVILHTKVYYDDIGIAYKATDKNDYFSHIIDCLLSETKKTCDIIDNAYLAYYYQMNHAIPTYFTECFTDWMKLSIDAINNMSAVDKIIGIIAENESSIYKNIKEILGEI